jgi:hypothetical protein
LKATGKAITAGVPTIIIGTTTVTAMIATITATATSPAAEAAPVEQSNPAAFGDPGLREEPEP